MSVEEAVRLLGGGEVVALPTETVYGLGGVIDRPEAISRIYALKGRPHGHPLIVHVYDDAEQVAVVDSRARGLIEQLWPGPLTLLLPRRASVPDAVTGGRDTVAVRSPAHPLIRLVLQKLQRPLAAPSANRFGRVSPTRAEHVAEELPGVPVLDGGPCAVGLESTIVDLTGETPALSRPGAIDRETLERLLGPLTESLAAAPGMLKAHYAPQTRLILCSPLDLSSTVAALRAAGLRVAVMPRGTDLQADAAALYDQLRRLDDGRFDRIATALAPERGLGVAINDRLRRAARGSAPPEQR